MYSILLVCSLDGQVRPTPVVPGFPGATVLPRPYEVVLPENEFLVRTVVKSNMTILHNRIEDFKRAKPNASFNVEGFGPVLLAVKLFSSYIFWGTLLKSQIRHFMLHEVDIIFLLMMYEFKFSVAGDIVLFMGFYC